MCVDVLCVCACLCVLCVTNVKSYIATDLWSLNHSAESYRLVLSSLFVASVTSSNRSYSYVCDHNLAKSQSLCLNNNATNQLGTRIKTLC